MWETVIAVLAIAALAGIAFVKSNLKVCPPNRILIFSGKKRKLENGTTVGFRIIKGGRAFKIPIVESVSEMSLETIPIELNLDGALSKGLIPLKVEAMANVKIAGSEEQGLSNAVERFLGKPEENVARVASQTLEGSLRGVLATLAPEEANNQRIKFAQEVMKEAADDFRRLGLVLDTLKVQDISDSQRYLEAIGRKKNAEVQRDATVAEAEAQAEARKVSAEAKEKGKVAEVEADLAVVEAENKLRVRKAELDAVSNRAEARAVVATEIARTEEEKLLEAERIELNKKKYQADIVVPAAAQKEADELKAAGEAAKIVEDGKATAEAIRLMRQEWEKGDTRELFLIQLLPEIIDKVATVISDNLSIERLTILDGGKGDGVPSLVKNLMGSVVSFMEGINSATGLDLPGILRTKMESPKQPFLKKEL